MHILRHDNNNNYKKKFIKLFDNILQLKQKSQFV